MQPVSLIPGDIDIWYMSVLSLAVYTILSLKLTFFFLGSDGFQQINDAEAVRLLIAKELEVKLLIADNDVTIAGILAEYLEGYNRLNIFTIQGENLDVVGHCMCRYNSPLVRARRGCVLDFTILL